MRAHRLSHQVDTGTFTHRAGSIMERKEEMIRTTKEKKGASTPAGVDPKEGFIFEPNQHTLGQAAESADHATHKEVSMMNVKKQMLGRAKKKE